MIAPSSVRAQTTATSATEPLVIHIFEPFRTQSPPSRRALRAHRAGVGAGVGLGQPEAADRLARVHPRQPALLLLLGAPAPDREHRQRALHRDEAADARVAGLELEAGQAVGDRARARAAVALEVHAEAGPSVPSSCASSRGRIPCSNHSPTSGRNRSRTNCAHGVADRALLVGEQGVDAEEVARVDRRAAGSAIGSIRDSKI